jgi:hypothetical protein
MSVVIHVVGLLYISREAVKIMSFAVVRRRYTVSIHIQAPMMTPSGSR